MFFIQRIFRVDFGTIGVCNGKTFLLKTFLATTFNCCCSFLCPFHC